MSERSSFVTEYVYCNSCFAELKNVLICNDKYLCTHVLPSWEGDNRELPIIAGKIGGLGPGDDYIYMKEIIDSLDLCHPVRFAFLGDDGTSVFLSSQVKTPLERKYLKVNQEENI